MSCWASRFEQHAHNNWLDALSHWDMFVSVHKRKVCATACVLNGVRRAATKTARHMPFMPVGAPPALHFTGCCETLDLCDLPFSHMQARCQPRVNPLCTHTFSNASQSITPHRFSCSICPSASARCDWNRCNGLSAARLYLPLWLPACMMPRWWSQTSWTPTWSAASTARHTSLLQTATRRCV